VFCFEMAMPTIVFQECDMSRDFFIVDAFSTVPFKGNPAAIILLHADDEICESVLQSIAAELNLSETAFVRPLAGGDAAGEFSLRWFTPTNEVPLCGHATLASAHALLTHPQRCSSLPRILHFNTLSGKISVEQLADGDLCMVLPLNDPVPCDQSLCAPSATRSLSLFSHKHLCLMCYV
jgi:PhzF family phenazine biosynthesis protein